ncbi:sulfite exporter TauE/SafE family protein [Novosphingobium sp. AAP93]|uniref:sulfite exporter TauE/SafE family protein n=1 Tax=Novosphingobium sp. AAP93 TaxID=1523427 RepID=UPI0006B9D8AB|nr:sulfite exporter TauE/SafE family protein [Novosphingobium sp. AAP93]KPF79013.1 hypothetical protein IP83_17365 [Novosphingobium sp. AAP93]
MPLAMILAALGSGAVIGLILAGLGAGGSILMTPLLVYMVGVSSAHAAVGTSAVAVTLNALVGLAGHARAGTVKWRCAGVFALAGVFGATLGAELGKALDGKRLLMLFGLLMVVVGLAMLRPRRGEERADVELNAASAGRLLPRLIPIGLGTGLLAGFFGIGGGFLIVPGLIAATAMPMRFASGTSLVIVAALGTTTATSYALSGYVDWPLVGVLAIGGAVGAALGIKGTAALASHRGLVEKAFAVLVIAVGVYVALGR